VYEINNVKVIPYRLHWSAGVCLAAQEILVLTYFWGSQHEQTKLSIGPSFEGTYYTQDFAHLRRGNYLFGTLG
jgi:hypothetical protein